MNFNSLHLNKDHCTCKKFGAPTGSLERGYLSYQCESETEVLCGGTFVIMASGGLNRKQLPAWEIKIRSSKVRTLTYIWIGETKIRSTKVSHITNRCECVGD